MLCLLGSDEYWYYEQVVYQSISLFCLWSCMLSVAIRCFGPVDACNSKRRYLCHIVGSCLQKSGFELTKTTKVVDVLLPLGIKQWCIVYMSFVLFILHTLFHAIICCLQLSTSSDADAEMKVDYLGIDELDSKSLYFVVMPN